MLPALNLGATDFVPNATFSFDPVSEPKAKEGDKVEAGTVPAVAAPEKKKRKRGGGGGGNKEEAKTEDGPASATAPAVKSEAPAEAGNATTEGEANPEADAAKPKKKKRSGKKKGAAAQDPSKFNIDAPVFAPSGDAPAAGDKSAIQLPKTPAQD